MRRRGGWLLLLVLAGCTSQPQGNDPAAECRRQAYDDPTVKRLGIEIMGQPGFDSETRFDYDQALRKATNTCLQQKGIAVRGGVEPVQPH